MSNDVDPLRLRFPALFREGYVDYADCRVRYTTEAAPEELVSRLHLVAVTTEAKIVVCRSEKGGDFFQAERGSLVKRCTTLRVANSWKKPGRRSTANPATSPRMWRTATEPSRFGPTCHTHARTGPMPSPTCKSLQHPQTPATVKRS